MTQESSILDLANDCFRFVTGYFKVISASSSHIYHSALVLAPKNSIVRGLYQSHAHPFTRIVHGELVSWDTSTAITHPDRIELAVWSPCNRFIAVARDGVSTMDILDSVTLQHLQTLKSPPGISTVHRALTFSPDSHILTCSSGSSSAFLDQELFVVSWDLQTGGIASVIRWKGPAQDDLGNTSITYSADGRMVGVLHQYPNTARIFICAIASGKYMGFHLLNDGILLSNDIWTHGESMQYTTTNTAAIIIWEIGFTLGAKRMKVKTLPAPSGFNDSRCTRVQLLPALCRLALSFWDKVLVWDAQNTTYLLNYTDGRFDGKMSFSPDGQFFACRTTGSEIYLWKESPIGYLPHKRLSSSIVYSNPLFSQTGESIIAFGGYTILLWRTNTSTTPPPGILTQIPQRNDNFLLDFSLDGTLAVVTMLKDTVVRVFNLKSGVQELTIDTSMEVYGLRVVKNTLLVITDQKVIGWELPVGKSVSNPRVDIEHSSLRVEISGWQRSHDVTYASISPDCHYIAFIMGGGITGYLCIYNTLTGKCLGPESSRKGVVAWFAPDRCNVWYANDKSVGGMWKVGRQDEPEFSVDPACPPAGYPWRSSSGYQVTNDWWVLGQDGKRLLMLPPPWQSDPVRRMWKGQFLALLHRGLSEPIILEMDPLSVIA